MNVMNSLRATEITPKAALLSIAIFLAAAAGVVAGVLRLLNPPAPAAREGRPPATALASTTPAAVRPPKNALPVTHDYAVIVKRNLFTSLGAAPAAPAPMPLDPLPPLPAIQETSAPLSPFTPFGGAPAVPTAPTATRPSLALTGVVEIAGDTYALIENNDLQLAQYTRVGGVAFGCTVKEIALRSAVLDYDGTAFTLNIGDNKVEPAPAPAPAPDASQRPRRPGPPDGIAPPAGNGGMPGAGRITRRRAQTDTPATTSEPTADTPPPAPPTPPEG